MIFTYFEPAYCLIAHGSRVRHIIKDLLPKMIDKISRVNWLFDIIACIENKTSKLIELTYSITDCLVNDVMLYCGISHTLLICFRGNSLSRPTMISRLINYCVNNIDRQ